MHLTTAQLMELLLLMLAGRQIYEHTALPFAQKYRIADQWLTARTVRLLIEKGYIRAVGRRGEGQSFEITDVGKEMLFTEE